MLVEMDLFVVADLLSEIDWLVEIDMFMEQVCEQRKQTGHTILIPVAATALAAMSGLEFRSDAQI